MTAVDSQRAAPPPAKGTGPAATGQRAAVLPPALVFAGFSVVFIARSATRYRGHVVLSLFDDAMISMRYARNLAHGQGLLWNPGQRPVEGITNLGWALWMALVHLVGFDGTGAVIAVLATNVALSILGLYLLRAVAEELWPDDRRPVAASVWITAVAYPLAFWSLRGMEVALLAALTTGIALVVLRLRVRPGDPALLRVLSACMVVSVLVRMDGLVVCATAISAAVWLAPTGPLRRRILLTLGGAVALAVAAQTVFRLAYYGDPLPNTYYLKVAGTPVLTRVQRGLESTWALALGSLLPLLGLAAFGIYAAWRDKGASLRVACLVLAALVATPLLYAIYVGGDAWEWMQIPNRYQTTSLPLLCSLAGGGLVRVMDLPTNRRRIALYASAITLLIAILASTNGMVPTATLQYFLNASGDVNDRFIAFGLATLILLVVAVRARASRVGVELVAGILAVTLGVSGQSLLIWARTGGLHVADDETMAVYGLVIRDSTAPAASVAVIWAGASPYFSGRPGVDLLGKSDRRIAHEAPKASVFYPGHTKWDYDWSVGHVRPDLVADYALEPANFTDLMQRWGYVNVWPKVWVRQDSPNLDRAKLVAGLAANPRISGLLNRH